jgi:hypothetical protein
MGGGGNYAIMSKKTHSQAENIWHMQYGRLSFKQTPDKSLAPSMLNFSQLNHQTHS